MQMNKINPKQTVYQLSNQLCNVIAVNICKLPSLPCTISFKVLDGSFIKSDPTFVFPKKKNYFAALVKHLTLMFFSPEVRQNIKHWKREEGSLGLNLELSGILKSFQVIIINHFRYFKIQHMIASRRGHKL